MKRNFSYRPARLLCLVALAFIPFLSRAQKTPGNDGKPSPALKIIKGKVTDSSGHALENVSVKLKNTRTGTTTAADGSFTIAANTDNPVLVFSRVGYTQQEITPGDNTNNVSVTLSNSKEELTDVIVVGYMQQSRTRTTAAISKLPPDELKNTSNPNPVQALQGKIAGVSIPITGGEPGSGATNIIIRGGTKPNGYGSGVATSGGNVLSSADDVSPLVVIDGVFRTASAMNDLNPDDIESLQVMKDAASTAIYGAQGANGVIVIKTKGGKFNSKMSLSLNHRTTWETQARSYNYINAEQYLRLARTTVKNTFDAIDKNNLLNNGGFSAGTRLYTAKGQYGQDINLTALYDNVVAIEGQDYVNNLLSKGWQTMDDPINPGTKLLYADNHYQDMLWNTGITQNDNVGINGGSDRASYNLSFGNTNQAGIFVGTRYKRYDALGNFSFKASDRFKVDVMLNYQNIHPNYVENFQNELIRGIRITPLIRIFKDNGDPTVGELYTVRNRFHTLKYDDARITTERYTTRVAGDWTITKGLHYRPSVSYFMEDYRYMFMRKATPAGEIQPSTQRQKNEYTNNGRQLMIDQVLQYDLTVADDHHFAVLGGVNYTHITSSSIIIGSQRATNDYIYTINEPPTTVINGVTTSNVTDFSTSLGETKSASLFGQLSYDYKARYLLSAALRYDGYSNFSPDNKYAYFPSVSAGWNVHEEKFWNVKFMNALKLRASWGGTGNSKLPITDTYGGYSATQYALSPGILRSNLSNPNLKWEETVTTDLAFDAAFFNSRLNLTVDFYDKRTKDRLSSKPLPSESPFPSITYNNGELQNKGVEIELGATVLAIKAFKWKTNFSFAFNRTLITKLPPNGRAKNRQGGDIIYDPAAKSLVEAGGFAEGERPYGLWAYKVDGVFATDAEAAAWNAKVKDNLASPQGIIVGKHAGDFIFRDVNSDGVIDSKDQVFMGYRNPDKIGGMQNTFTYKGVSLRFTMDYALGHMIANGALARSLGQGRAFNEGAPQEALGPDIWQKSGDAGKTYARFSFADYDFGQRNYLRSASLGNNASYATDVSAMYSKGDFLAFRELSVAYDIPAGTMRRIHATGMNVFFSVYNLGYLTSYKGLNPEIYSGYDPGGYPRPRQYSLGATLRF